MLVSRSRTRNPTWSNMRSPRLALPPRSPWRRCHQPVLEDVAVAACQPAERPGRKAGGAAEGVHEVRDIAEARLETRVADGARLPGKQARRPPQPHPHEVLVRGDPQRSGEEAEEVKAAEAGVARHQAEVDL